MKTKSKCVFGLSKLTPEAKVIKVQSVKDGMQNSGNFPNATMPISYSAWQTLIDNSHNANVTASNGTSADVSMMHEEERILVMACNLVKAHVDMVCNTFPNPDSIILSAGLSVSSNAGPNAVTDLTLDAIGSGTIQIRVPRTKADKAFVYQYALDSAPTNWQNIGFYSLSKIEFKNQIPGTIIHIRYAAIGNTGAGAYSNSKQIMAV